MFVVYSFLSFGVIFNAAVDDTELGWGVSVVTLPYNFRALFKAILTCVLM